MLQPYIDIDRVSIQLLSFVIIYYCSFGSC